MVLTKHHNDMKGFLSTFIGELFEAFTPEEDSSLESWLRTRRGKRISSSSLYTGSGIGDLVPCARSLVFNSECITCRICVVRMY